MRKPVDAAVRFLTSARIARKIRVAESMRKRWRDPDYRERVLKARRESPRMQAYQATKVGRNHSDKTRAKVSRIVRDSWRNEDVRQRRVRGLVRQWVVRKSMMNSCEARE